MPAYLAPRRYFCPRSSLALRQRSFLVRSSLALRQRSSLVHCHRSSLAIFLYLYLGIKMLEVKLEGREAQAATKRKNKHGFKRSFVMKKLKQPQEKSTGKENPQKV
ncbi:hypothetical protein VNO80_16740 [Phaseolus coccineus]|uniref:Uncharacterized protein n=1 Tax=Phaseolus coccineus TaxID=3886 RepID=A0AAN9R499_PHACN